MDCYQLSRKNDLTEVKGLDVLPRKSIGDFFLKSEEKMFRAKARLYSRRRLDAKKQTSQVGKLPVIDFAMYLHDWKKQWITIFLIIMNGSLIQSDMFHYYKLKKFLTAVAFARALGRRPTILPIPIPVPIPIQQNEVIRIPSQKGGGKTVVALSGGGGNQKFPSGISSLLTGGPLSSLTGAFSGSSNFGYSLPGISTSDSGIQTNGANVIDLSSLSSANNVIRTSSSNSAANLGGTRIMVVDPQTLGNLLNSANAANVGSPQIQFASNNPGNSFQFDNGLGNNFGDLESAFSLNAPQRIRIPWYSDFPNRKIPFRFRSGRMRNREGSRQEFEMDLNEFDNRHPSNKNRYTYNNNRYTNNNRHRNQNRNPDSNWGSTSSHQHTQKKPIPVGEKFQARY